MSDKSFIYLFLVLTSTTIGPAGAEFSTSSKTRTTVITSNPHERRAVQ